MLEDNLGRKNRWEHVSPGEQSHIAQFAAEFELASSILPKEASGIHKPLMELLYVGLQRDMTYSQLIQRYSDSDSDSDESYRYSPRGLFFREVRDLKDRPFKAMLGLVMEGEVFVTNRNGWANGLDAPHITGFKRSNKLSIDISSNGVHESKYNHEVIPGTNFLTVVIGEEGDVTGITWRGERKELTEIQKHGLAEMLKEIKGRAMANLDRNKETLAKFQST